MQGAVTKPWTFEHAKQQARKSGNTNRSTVDEKIRVILEHEQKTRKPTKAEDAQNEENESEEIDSSKEYQSENSAENEPDDEEPDQEELDEGDSEQIVEDRTRDYREYLPGKKRNQVVCAGLVFLRHRISLHTHLLN